jgi:hypothetical protein
MATFDINNTARRAQYTSTGQAGPFAFNFQVNASSELKVYINDVEKTETTHYTVSLNANGTGSVTFTTATTSGELITIIGDQPLSRTTVFQVGQANNPTTLETEFDNVIIRQQQIKEITDRALQLKPSTPRTVTGSGTSGPIYWPYDATAANNANKVIKYDSAGTGLELGPTTTDISTIAGIAADVTTVSGIAADVTAVAADATDIGIVSSNISSVQTVATNINDVITVANDLNEAVSEVETVANDLNEAVSEIDTVGNNITYVQTVGDSTNIANITTVAGQITPTNNISTVASANANISTVATDLSGSNTIGTVATDLSGANNIGTVVTNISNVNTVGTNLSGSNTIGTVATNINDVNTVAADTADIQTLADIEDGTVATNAVSNAGNNSTNITTVAGQISPTNNISTVAAAAPNIATVAGQISPTNNISTVAGANANISTIASNLTGANTIGTVAADLSGSNTIGTVATNIADVQDVANNIAGVNSFAERYRVASSDPTTSLDAGDLAFNTSGNVFKYYDGSSWQQITAGGITDIAQDSTPQLGGNLDLNSNDITGTGNVNITGNVSLTGTVDGRNIATDGTKLDTIATSATANPNAIDNVVEDTTPQLGGNLDLNSSDITGTGNVNITGTITSSGDITTSGVLNSIAPTRHSIRPSLNLDFANSKALDPRITFTRASNATYYDGYTSVKAEENLINYSQEFDNAVWIKTGASITANDTTAPDGTTTAELIYPVSSNCYIIQPKNTNGNPIVISVYAKTQNKSVVYLFHYNAAQYGVYYLDTSDGSTSSISGSVTTGTMTATDVGNGWYRFSVSFSSSFGGGNSNFGIGVSDAKGSITVTPNSTDGIHIWGAQLEQRDSLTAYTPTTTAPITNINLHFKQQETMLLDLTTIQLQVRA